MTTSIWNTNAEIAKEQQRKKYINSYHYTPNCSNSFGTRETTCCYGSLNQKQIPESNKPSNTAYVLAKASVLLFVLTNKRSFAINTQKIGLLFSFLYYNDLILED